MTKILIWSAIALVVGLIGGAVLVVAIGLAPSGRLDCTIDEDDTVTTCTNSDGNKVDVPHDIHISNR